MKMNLEKYKKKSGFKIPNNYMDDFESNLFEKLEISSDSLKNIKPGFLVPTDYFETIEGKIQERVNAESARGKLIKLFSSKKVYYAASIAAIFLILFSTVLLKSPQASDLNNLDYAAMEQYIEDEDLDYNDISNLIYEEGLIMDNFDSYSLNDQAVFEYLNENVEDSGLILE